MKIYQVGGAVRDKILGKKPNDFDYVVIGSNLEEMKNLGFEQVGKSFPVFLHPVTKEEYALARKEIKTGNKHTDFEFIFTPDITLKEDLERRDFTCNAIAYDEEKQEYIDYFNGLNDIKNKIIRHVNAEHFIEDPLRVLRMCRFAAQLNFDVDVDTLKLCTKMVNDKTLQFLSAERIWQEFEKAFSGGMFCRFIEIMHQIGALKEIMPEFDKLFFVPEKIKYHPEGNCAYHTLNALKFVNKENTLIQFAVLMHDLGKGLTPKHIAPSHTAHEMRGLEAIKNVCKKLKVPNKIERFAIISSLLHMKYYYIPDMKISSLYDLVSALNFGNKCYVEEYIKVCRADFESTQFADKNFERDRFLYAAEKLRKTKQILEHIKATDMPNYDKLPKDENFGLLFREYKIGRLKKEL